MAPNPKGNKKERAAKRAARANARNNELATLANIRRVRAAEATRRNGMQSLVQAVNQLKKLSFKPQLPKEFRGKKGKVVKSNPKTPIGKLITSIIKPFHSDALNAYLPTLPGRNTFKTFAEVRFEATIGTSGFGFILISPTIANNEPAFFYSNASFAGTAAQPWASVASATNVGTLATGVSWSALPLPFASGVFSGGATAYGKNPGAVGRLVSIGVSSFYIGTTQNEGGMVYCYVDPDHNDLTGVSLSDLGKRRECEITSNSRDKCEISAAAIDSDEQQFGSSYEPQAWNDATITNHISGKVAVNFPWSKGNCPDFGGTAVKTFTETIGGTTTTYDVSVAPMVICFTGIAGQQVHIEYIQHVEYFGTQCEGLTSASDVDVPGTQRVLAATNKAYAIKSSDRCSFATAFSRALKMCK